MATLASAFPAWNALVHPTFRLPRLKGYSHHWLPSRDGDVITAHIKGHLALVLRLVRLAARLCRLERWCTIGASQEQAFVYLRGVLVLRMGQQHIYHEA